MSVALTLTSHAQSTRAPGWVHSFALRDDLFLDLRAAEGGFDSHTLAHETTHAIVSRLYGNRHWPLWLSEGFAEYMGQASVAARNSRSPRSNQRKLQFAEMAVAELFATQRYLEAPLEVVRLYDTSAKVRSLSLQQIPARAFSKVLPTSSSTAARQSKRWSKSTAANFRRCRILKSASAVGRVERPRSVRSLQPNECAVPSIVVWRNSADENQSRP